MPTPATVAQKVKQSMMMEFGTVMPATTIYAQIAQSDQLIS